MNYRHAFHAGNFADVLKHAVLALVLAHLTRKAAPFRVIDTHAGIGLYDLTGEEAQRTGEWREGIGRLLVPGASPPPMDIAQRLAPYLAAVRSFNPGDALVHYPGSPLISLTFMRADDRLIANELHPEDVAALRRAVGGDRRAKVLSLDGWTALKSLLPPKERRGVILIDPPFEKEGELARMARGLGEAVRRFETGVYLLWYPIKDPRAITPFHQQLGEQGLRDVLAVELLVRAPEDVSRLNGCGLVVANSPYTLGSDLERLLPWLAATLAQGPGAEGRVLTLG